MSLEDISNGELAAVVTFLEMLEPPQFDTPESTLRLRRVAEPTLDQYRALFRKIGAPWLWFSRLALSDTDLAAIIGHPEVHLYEVAAVEAVVGMLELDFREPGQCELAFVGLVPGLSGQGHGRWLLAHASARQQIFNESWSRKSSDQATSSSAIGKSVAQKAQSTRINPSSPTIASRSSSGKRAMTDFT